MGSYLHVMTVWLFEILLVFTGEETEGIGWKVRL